MEQTKGEYVLQMAPCTGEYLFKEEIYVNDYLVKKVKLYTCEKKGDRWLKFIEETWRSLSLLGTEFIKNI